MIASTRARQRAWELHATSARPPRDLVHELVVAHLAGLALPPSAGAAAPYLPACALVLAACAFAVAGWSGLVALGVLVVATEVGLRRTAQRRRAASTERALPALLDAVARHLRAGGSLGQAITAARPPDSAPDLQRSWTRLTGLIPVVGVVAALDDWTAASAVPTAGSGRSRRLAAAALSLAATTGGSPARAIDGVAATLRSRLAVADEIRALSSQARASAVVIALAPLAFGVVAGISDQRTRAFLASTTGVSLVAAGLVLDGAGAWWMAKLCRPSEIET